jgi:hypothetical protein
MKTPNRNYLAAQNKNLIRAGTRLANLVMRGAPFTDLEKAIKDWDQAKENLMGLAGR